MTIGAREIVFVETRLGYIDEEAIQAFTGEWSIMRTRKNKLSMVNQFHRLKSRLSDYGALFYLFLNFMLQILVQTWFFIAIALVHAI